MERAAPRKIVAWAHIVLDFPGIGSIAVGVDGPFWVAAPPGPERRACGGVSIALPKVTAVITRSSGASPFGGVLEACPPTRIRPDTLH